MEAWGGFCGGEFWRCAFSQHEGPLMIAKRSPYTGVLDEPLELETPLGLQSG